MKILVVSQYYWPETFRINEVVESLIAAGASVSVLTGQPNYPDGQVFTGYRAGAVETQIHDSGYSIHRVPLIPRGNGNALRLILNYLSFVVSATVMGAWLLRGQRFDVVFVYAPSPILQVIPAIWLSWLKRAKLVTWVQDLWPESLRATGFVRNPTILRSVSILVRWLYRRNDLLLVQSEAFIKPVQSMAGQTPVMYHPNPGELRPFQEATDNAQALQLQPGFNLVFAGNLGTVQALDTVLEAAAILKPYVDVRLILVGSGSRLIWLQREISSRELSNVLLPGRFEAAVMPGIFAQASALLVSLARNAVLSQTVPSKVQAYLAAGRPLIASLDGEGARVVLEAGAGLTCPAEDAQALASAVLKLRAASAEDLQRMGQSGRRYYEANFDPVVLANHLLVRLQKLANMRSFSE